MKYENTMIYLMGFAGSGKLSIAKEIAKLAPFKIVDAHTLANPIFNLIPLDSHNVVIPETAWKAIAQIRDIIFDTILHISPPNFNFIFTHEAFAEDPYSIQFYGMLETLSNQRGSHFVPIRLICDEEELVKRVQSPDRLLNLKTQDVRRAQHSSQNRQVFQSHHPHELTIDNTHLTSKEAALSILNSIKSS